MKLYYIYDALCGWCYGFSPVMREFYCIVKEELPLEVISGGMVIGEREGRIGNVAPYIKDAYKVVEERTEVKFGEAFLKELDKGDMYFSSLTPAIAMAAFKMLKDIDQVEFAHEIQNAIYFNGKEPSDEQTYIDLLEKFEIKKATCLQHFNSNVTEELALQDFKLTQQLKVQGFPCVFIAENKEFIMIAHGYTPIDQLKVNYEKGKEMLLKKRNS